MNQAQHDRCERLLAKYEYRDGYYGIVHEARGFVIVEERAHVGERTRYTGAYLVREDGTSIAEHA